MNNCQHFDSNISSDPLDILFECSVEDLMILESVGANDTPEFDDNLNDDDDLSIDPDDLKEWTYEEPCENYKSDEDSIDFYLEPNSIKTPTCSNSTVEGVQIDGSMNVYSSISDRLPNRISITSQNLECADSQIDSNGVVGQHAFPQHKSDPVYSLPIHPSSVQNVNDLFSGKRNSLTSDLEESRKLFKRLKNCHQSGLAGNLVTKLQESEKRLKMLKTQSSVLKYNKFFTGEQTSLTPELESSRNRLKVLIDLDTPPMCIVNHRAACA